MTGWGSRVAWGVGAAERGARVGCGRCGPRRGRYACAFRYDHRARPRHRRHRSSLVCGGRRHPRRSHCRHRPPRQGPRQAAHRCAGRVVAPGFIDMLGQSELTLLVDPHVPSKVFQGITTEITGEGESVAPVNEAIARENAKTIPALRHQARLVRLRGLLRSSRAAGNRHQPRLLCRRNDRARDGDRLRRPRADARRARADAGAGREAMRQGAVGVSSSLEYAPAPYASTEELIALARTAAEYGGIYATHMRSEQEAIMTAHRRDHPHRPRSAHPGRDLASEGGRGRATSA